jgi:hypothetical protein
MLSRTFNPKLLRTLSLFLGTLTISALNAQTLVTAISTAPQPPVITPGPMAFSSLMNKLYVGGGNGQVAILNGSTNKRAGSIALPGSAPITQILVNTLNGQVYISSASTLTLVDARTDAVLQTVAISPSTFGAAAYNPVLNQLDVTQVTGATSQLVARDGNTLAVLTTLASPAPSTFPQAPTLLTMNTGTRQLFGFGTNGGATWLWIWDATTNALIDQSSCTATCTKLLGGTAKATIINPVDNSVWILSFFQLQSAAGGDEAGGGLLFPFETVLTRITYPLPAQMPNLTTWGAMAPAGFDTASGKIVGFANCVPTVPNPAASTAPCANTLSGFFAIDPNGSLGITGHMINASSFARNPGDQVISCGQTILGYDLDLGYGYWSCNGSGVGAVGNISIVKYDFTEAPDTSFPPAINGTRLVALPTHAKTSPTLIQVMTLNPQTHRAFFPQAVDNTVISVDPVAPTLVTELLSSRAEMLAVNPATNTVYLAEDTGAQITTINGATSTVSNLHVSVATGPFIAINSATNQFVMAGSTDLALDPQQATGAFLYDGLTNGLLRPLNAAASGGVIFDPPSLKGVGTAVNPVTNRAYFLNQMQWYVVDTTTGNRIFTGNDFAGGSALNVCQFSGITVNSKTNRYYVIGQCPASIAGPYTIGVFDGNTNALIAQSPLEIYGNPTAWGRVMVNPNTNRLYIEMLDPNSFTPNSIITHDGATLQRIGVFTLNGTGIAPSFPMAINTVTNRIYATFGTVTANGFRSQLFMIDGGVDAFGRTDVVLQQTVLNAATPRAIAVNETTGMVYVESDTPLMPAGAPAFAGPGVNVFAEPPVPPKFSLKGTVTNKSGVGLAGITVQIDSSDGGGIPVVTDATGTFSISGLPAGTYTVFPDSSQYFYTPASQTVTITAGNVTGVTFSATPAYKVSGRILDINGQGIPNTDAVYATGFATSDATGAFTLTNVVPGTYAVSVAATGPCCFAPVTVTVTNADVSAVVLQRVTPITITGLSFNPTMIGANVTSTGTITLNQPAPQPIVVQIQGSAKLVKFPATVTIPAGASSATFSAQATGVGSVTPVPFTAVYAGPFAVTTTFANATLTLAPVDSLKVTSATWSKSTQLLTINATSSNAQSTLTVLLSSNNQALGTMTNQGNGSFTFQAPFVSGTPAAITLKSVLGGSTGQGVSVVP